MREFVPAGGELMIHAALHPKNSPASEVINPPDNGKKTCFCFKRMISHPECSIFQGLIRG